MSSNVIFGLLGSGFPLAKAGPLGQVLLSRWLASSKASAGLLWVSSSYGKAIPISGFAFGAKNTSVCHAALGLRS